MRHICEIIMESSLVFNQRVYLWLNFLSLKLRMRNVLKIKPEVELTKSSVPEFFFFIWIAIEPIEIKKITNQNNGRFFI